MSNIRNLAHTAWRLLPQEWRQNAYEQLTIALAPNASSAKGVAGGWEPPFVVVGPLSAPTGLGESARLLLHGLINAGVPVSYVDLTEPLMQSRVVPLPQLAPPALGPGTLLLAVQPPSVAHALLLLGRRLLAGKRRVGFWMWELETLPRSWRRSLPLVHELAAPSRFAGSVLERELNAPVVVLGFPFQDQPVRPATRKQTDPVTFGVGFDIGSTAARKNPFGAVEAFRRAFPGSEAVSLLMKVRGEEADPQAFARLAELAASPGSRIELVRGDLDQNQLAAWFDRIDVLVSLHRSEGFGLFPAEAMLRGIPVIATDWSATTEFVIEGVGWPVPASLIPVEETAGRYALPGAVWADPHLDDAAAAMRHAFELGHDGLTQRGRSAKAFMMEHYSHDAFRQRLQAQARRGAQP